MYKLMAKNDKEELVVLDDKIPDDFAEERTAEQCGEFYPNYHDFVLTKIENEGANEVSN